MLYVAADSCIPPSSFLQAQKNIALIVRNEGNDNNLRLKTIVHWNVTIPFMVLYWETKLVANRGRCSFTSIQFMERNSNECISRVKQRIRTVPIENMKKKHVGLTSKWEVVINLIDYRTKIKYWNNEKVHNMIRLSGSYKLHSIWVKKKFREISDFQFCRIIIIHIVI